jgi:hypothetical protein
VESVADFERNFQQTFPSRNLALRGGFGHPIVDMSLSSNFFAHLRYSMSKLMPV